MYKELNACLLAVGFFAISYCSASAAKMPPDPKMVAERAVSLFMKYDKSWIAGQCAGALKKDGYRITEISYGQYYAQEFDIELTGILDVVLICDVDNDSANAKTVRGLGVSDSSSERDNFLWRPEKGFAPHYNSRDTKPSPNSKENMNRLMEQLRVTRIILRLQRPDTDTRSAYKQYGTLLVKALESRLGKPNSKVFIWDTGEGWMANWKKKRIRLDYGNGEAGSNLVLDLSSRTASGRN